ncbi:hypothetical protein JCM8097_002234 [Rhodosporidiobolus ruineniae]
MAPSQGSPPTSPIPMHAPPAAQDYQHLVRSLQRRSAGRLAQDAARGGQDGATTVSHDLEADLRLAAEVGQALLRDKTALQQRLDAAEKANDKLLAKLSDGVKENARMQRRLEETVGSLEQADASNRALLVSLEEDRKTISRLSIDSGRLAAATATLTTLKRSHEDAAQEAASERKRADAAEAKCKKLEQRNVELDVRLKKANADLEELRQDKVLRTKRSVDTLAKLRARYTQDGSTTVSTPPAGEAVAEEEELSENTEAKELLKMVETLVTENNLLRSESMELHGLLQASRDEQVDHTSPPSTADPAFADKLEDQLAKAQVEQATPTLPQYSSFSSASSSRPPPPPASDSIISPSISQALTDYDFGRRPSSPSSTNATSYFTRSHDASASFSYSRNGAADMSRTLSGDSLESDGLGPAFQQGLVRKTSRKRPPPVTSASTGVLGHGRVPVGQRHSRRALSMDVTASVRGELSSAPNSPRLDYSPSTRALSIFSTTSEDPELSSRPRRHHRPLSLSLGPSIFPQVPEDDDQQQDPLISPFTRQPSHRRRPSQAPSLASDPGRLGISSSRRPRASFSPERERPALVTVDSGTQTSPPTTPAQVPRVEHSQASTPDRSSTFSHSPSPRGAPARSHTSLSELSDERSYDPSSSSPRSGPTSLHPSAAAAAATAAQVEQRTAALGQLIEHVAKLLARVQGADIATQEKRLMKQHLSGDVKHIAQANLRDLVTDIEAVRHHFRRIVELERAAHVKSFQTLDSSRSVSPSLSSSPSSATPNPNDSLVTRRDFVLLVKLLRDLLLETTRLRSILNRVQLDPSLASSLRELDVPSALEPEMPAAATGASSSSGAAAAAASAAAATAGGLLAPLSRLFGGAGGADEPSLAHRASSAQLRPPPKRTGTVSTAAVNVEFGGGAVRHASSSAAAGAAAAGAGRDGGKGLLRPPSQPGQHRQVKREISSIFAGAASSSSSSSRSATPAAGSTEPWVVLPSTSTSSSSAAPIPTPAAAPAPAGPASRLTLASAASSYIPFGRLLSSYRPAMSSTTNAVLDPLPHAPPARAPRPPRLAADTALDSSDEDSDDDDDDDGPQETLLERQLRPRGLSDSSIRSSYLQHGARANPHHRLLTPAALALSAEPKMDVLSTSPAGVGAPLGGGAALDALKTLGSVSRQPSTADLRKKPSSSRLRESAVVLPSEAEPAPPMPTLLSTSVVSSASSVGEGAAVPIAISPPKDAPSPVGGGPTGGAPGLFGTVVSSAFGSLSASVAAGEGGRKGERGEGGVRKGESSGRAG